MVTVFLTSGNCINFDAKHKNSTIFYRPDDDNRVVHIYLGNRKDHSFQFLIGTFQLDNIVGVSDNGFGNDDASNPFTVNLECFKETK